MIKYIIALFLIFLVGCSAGSNISLEAKQALANCLAEKGVKEYGAFWCPNCAKQKKMFGSAYGILIEKGVYVECDPKGDNPQSELCIEKNVQKYPDWEFADGTRVVGVMDLDVLAGKAGCALQP